MQTETITTIVVISVGCLYIVSAIMISVTSIGLLMSRLVASRLAYAIFIVIITCFAMLIFITMWIIFLY